MRLHQIVHFAALTQRINAYEHTMREAMGMIQGVIDGIHDDLCCTVDINESLDHKMTPLREAVRMLETALTEAERGKEADHARKLTMLGKLLCWLGLHDWGPKQIMYDGWLYRRECKRCRSSEKGLAGHAADAAGPTRRHRDLRPRLRLEGGQHANP